MIACLVRRGGYFFCDLCCRGEDKVPGSHLSIIDEWRRTCGEQITLLCSLERVLPDPPAARINDP